MCYFCTELWFYRKKNKHMVNMYNPGIHSLGCTVLRMFQKQTKQIQLSIFWNNKNISNTSINSSLLLRWIVQQWGIFIIIHYKFVQFFDVNPVYSDIKCYPKTRLYWKLLYCIFAILFSCLYVLFVASKETRIIHK